jgi:hypothetical protein
MVDWTLDLFFGREIEQTVTPRDIEALTDGLARLRARGKQGIRTAGNPTPTV